VSRVTYVLAVEPNFDTMCRLAMSVVLGNVHRKVTLIYSAVTNRITTLNLAYLPGNPGHTIISTNSSCEGVKITVPGLKCLNRPVKSVMLDDLLPFMKYKRAIFKVDVEGNEVNVFTEETASVFFRHIDVPMIMMEFLYNVERFKKVPAWIPLVERMLEFFKGRSYQVFDTNKKPLTSDWSKWPLDILFIKTSFVSEAFD
jgi:FkbM family methyltransferase